MSSAWWMGGERTRVRAAGDRLQDRSLELDEAALLEHRADRAQDRGARQHRSSRRLVGDQVEVPAALLQIRVLQPVPLLGEGPQRLREHPPALGEQAELAAPRRAHRALHTDDVAEVQLAEQHERVRVEPAAVEHHLELGVAVTDRREHQLAQIALQHDTAGEDGARLRHGVGPQIGVRRAEIGDRRRPVDAEDRPEVQRERASRPQALERRAPGREDLGLPARRLLGASSAGSSGAPGLLGLLSHRPAPGSARGPAGGPRA